jgi:hypothetical protein
MYLSGSESSVNNWITSRSGRPELLLDEVAVDTATESPPLDTLEGVFRSSCSGMSSGTGGSSACFWFFSFRRRRDLRSLEKPLEPAFAESGVSPACVLGLSMDSIEERPLLRLELSNRSESAADTVQERRDLLPPPPPLRLEEEESAMARDQGRSEVE